MKLVFAKKFSFLSRTLLIIISFLLRLWKMEFFSQKKGLLFYLEHDFSSYFDREQIEKKIAFFDQSKGKSLLKMLILGLYYQTLFCNQDRHQTLFLVVFWGGTKKEKFKFSYKNYGFTPLEKCDFSDIKIVLFTAIFYLQHHQALVVVVFLPKTNKEKFEFMDQNHGLTPLEKYNSLYFENCCFRNLKFLYIFRTSLNTIPRRILGLLHCGPRFTRHIASV